jgi:aconitate hydratase
MTEESALQRTRRSLEVHGQTCHYYSLPAAEAAGLPGISRLPYTLKVLLENLIRHNAQGRGDAAQIQGLADWLKDPARDCEVSFLPARALMPDSSGIVLLGDMAAMRDAMVGLGADPKRVNPAIPLDFVVDHSVMVDAYGTPDALRHNMGLEFWQNRERYEFLCWASRAFNNLRVFPPGSGILHQINVEHLARVVWTQDDPQGGTLAYPDSLIAMDSHTATINAMGVVGWGVGGFEGGAAAVGEPVSVLIPEVVGCRLVGALAAGVTATDLVLAMTQRMRRENVIGCFVEYFGPGVDTLPLPARATVSNMTPECGATLALFPVDQETVRYLAATGRDARQVALVEAYCRAQGLWRDGTTPVPAYNRVFEFNLAEVAPSVAGPSRPDARLALHEAPAALHKAVARPKVSAAVAGRNFDLSDGDVVLAAITSCTNTSNPMVMIGAGLLARNARRRGLRSKPWVKTSLSPGSRVVADYLAQSGLQRDLDELGFHVTGFGCMSCMGNSGPLPEPIVRAIESRDIAAVAVLSGNRNFDGRIHPNAKLNFLASPPLVVAYAIAGTLAVDMEKEPLGQDQEGKPVYLRDIWPDDEEIRAIMARHVSADVFTRRYANILQGTPQWQSLTAEESTLYPWNPRSHFIKRPPYFEGMSARPAPRPDIRGARILGLFGDMLTTDHISPIGVIGPDTPAGKYLREIGVEPGDFVNYAARRLNHDVMIRGTFANIRLKNEMTPGVEGSSTVHYPDGARMSIFDASERYRATGVPLVVIGGREYGAGSSRDWAAKGTALLGVQAVIAESLERIHRSNLVSMGVLPLQFEPGTTRLSLDLKGDELLDLTGLTGPLTPRMRVSCRITRPDGGKRTIALIARLDSQAEIEYYRHGGIVPYVLRRRIGAAH